VKANGAISCDFERYRKTLFAIDIPANANVETILDKLLQARDEGLLEIEEGYRHEE
jgi:hypothetical protein